MKQITFNKKTGDVFLAIGVFDGVHKGHQKILKSLVRKARAAGALAAVATFDPHPAKVTRPHLAPPMLLSLEHRLKIIKAYGVDRVYIMNFTGSFANVSAADFVKDRIVGRIKARELFVGENFNFGRGGEGRPLFLKKCGLSYGFRVNVIKTETVGGETVSSTRIRKLVMHGDLDEAAKLLGRRYSILGNVVPGRGIGRRLGYPTANLNFHHEAIPPSGVYAVLVRMGGRMYKGAMNIGFTPTLAPSRERLVEVYILGFKKNIYGRKVEAIFVKRIRRELAFKSEERLKSRIAADIKDIKTALAVSREL